MTDLPVPIQTVDTTAAAAAAAAASASEEEEAAPLLCNPRSCKHTATRDVLVIPCAKPSCPKGMHLSCFTSAYKNVQVVHAKGCNKAVASPKALTWRNNGPVGREVDESSERILLDWITEEGNYALYQGGPQTKGKTKKKVAAQIACIINHKGVRFQRNAKQAENKIQHIEKQFRLAHGFANSVTGAGLQENDPGSFEDAVKQKCSQYYFLLDVMIERSSMKPKAANTLLDSSKSEDDNDDEEEEEEDGEVALARPRIGQSSHPVDLVKAPTSWPSGRPLGSGEERLRPNHSSNPTGPRTTALQSWQKPGAITT
jgi:hypothetical protein